jgi:hypothetical protein
MKVFRDMLIWGEPERLAATMDDVERRLSDGWSRDAAAEEDLRTMALRREPTPDLLT